MNRVRRTFSFKRKKYIKTYYLSHWLKIFLLSTSYPDKPKRMEKHVTLCTISKINSILEILSYLREMNLVCRQKNVKIWGRAALLKPKIEGRSSAHLTVILFVELLTGGGGGCVALTFSYVASFCCWPCLRNIWDFFPQAYLFTMTSCCFNFVLGFLNSWKNGTTLHTDQKFQEGSTKKAISFPLKTSLLIASLPSFNLSK